MITLEQFGEMAVQLLENSQIHGSQIEICLEFKLLATRFKNSELKIIENEGFVKQ